MHHSGIGELMYHMYRMMYAGAYISQLYHANKDLVMAGCLLHDIGKVREMETDNLANTIYTLDGQLETHLSLGMDMVKNYGKVLGTSEEVLKNIVHIIASHHGQQEFGAITKPKTLEAYIVSICDDLDARAYMYEEMYKKLEPGQISDDRRIGINVNVYRPAL